MFKILFGSYLDLVVFNVLYCMSACCCSLFTWFDDCFAIVVAFDCVLFALDLLLLCCLICIIFCWVC